LSASEESQEALRLLREDIYEDNATAVAVIY